MKKGVLIPIIIGSVLLAGSATFGVFAYLSLKDNPSITNTYVVSNPFTKIDINVETTNIKIEPSIDTNCYVVCNEYEKEKHNVDLVSDALTIRTVDERTWFEKLISRPKYIVLSVPASAYQSLTIVSATGDIEVKGDITYSDVNIKVSTGDVSLLSHVAHEAKIESTTGFVNVEKNHLQNLTAKSTTGGIKISECQILSPIQLNASTGDISIISSNVKDVTAETTTGRIKIEDSQVGALSLTNTTGKHSLIRSVALGDITINSTTGDVQFVESDGANITVTTTTGDIYGSLLTTKLFSTKTSTGSVNIPDSGGTYQCKLTTTTGDINITIA